MWEWKPVKLLRCLSPRYATAVHLLYFQSLTQQEEEKNQVPPMFDEQIILCTLIFIQCLRHEVEKMQEGSLMPQRSWMKLCMALHLSPQQGQCTVYLLAADLRCHWDPISLDVVWGREWAGASVAFLAPSVAILQVERSFCFLDL